MISRNSKNATFFACALSLVNLLWLPGALLQEFRTRSLPIIFIWPYHAMGAISRNFDTPTFFEHGRARSFAVAPGYTPLGIFAHGRIQYYLFGLMMLQA